MSGTPTFISTIKDAATSLINADGTAFKTLLAGSGSGQRIRSIQITSDDTAQVTLQFCKTIGAVDYILGEIVVAIGSGTNGTAPAVNGLDPLRMPGLQTDGIRSFLDLGNASTLKVKSKVAVTAAKTVNVVAEYGDV